MRRGRGDRIGDGALFGLTILASLVVIAAIVAIIYKVLSGSSSAFSLYGLGFLGHATWIPNTTPQFANGFFGAAAFIYGTLVSSTMALLLAGPIGIAIGLFLSLLAPGKVSAVIGPLVELLAAIPSVVLGLWGILVLAPVLRDTVEPALHSALGWIPLFGAPSPTGLGVFTAGIILTIMVVPIIASISRELFLSVPSELKDGRAGARNDALGDGARRRAPLDGSGLARDGVLGLSRALGEAIAVAQVIGAGSAINAILFNTGDTLASRIALQFPAASSPLGLIAVLSRGDPARDRDRHEPHGATIVRRFAPATGERSPLMATLEGSRSIRLAPLAPATCAAASASTGSCAVSATAAAMLAVAVLLHRDLLGREQGASQLSLGFLTKARRSTARVAGSRRRSSERF